jgi:hypothetical protein
VETCGIAEGQRFTFYDQRHTTGTDIHQILNAKAALTLGTVRARFRFFFTLPNIFLR